MKKVLAIILTAVLCLCGFTACSNGANRFYNSKVLKEFQITDFPKPQGVEDFEATNSSLSFNTTAEGFEDYAEQIYTYLVEKDFKYFGYRGDVISTFFGGVPEYEFYLSSEFSEHQYLVDRNGNEYENYYIFVFSNELSENNGLLNKCEIEVRYHPDDEEYNSFVSISYTNNALFSYTLITDNTEEHEHTYEYYHDDTSHGWSYTCGCMTPPNQAQHFDSDGDGKCDESSCEYVMVSYSISYDFETLDILMNGFAPTEAKPGNTIQIHAYPIMDADLVLYANGVKLIQTYADSDFWEYIFTMPNEDVVITYEIVDGFLSK